ncbi:plasmid pRiA4b ORF-3 family protein [Mesorhizobium newzealandense]|uniref:Plasmid pRiA4b ORF-3 family protein n=2 Tax=Mesorhizobium TaxID=68287 RepID=A0ABW4U6J1_9HYPH
MLFQEPNALQIRIELAGIEPAVWRRVVVPWNWHLGQLHLVIQAAFNWWNYHLHEFRVGGLSYGDPEQLGEMEYEGGSRSFDENEVRLLDFEHHPGLSFIYLYDFGDHWEHLVTIEKFLTLDPIPRTAACIDGAHARPPEDVGGIGGFENFLAIMADREDPEHRDMRRWCGGHFDPQWFDLTVADKDVRNALKPNVRRRLHQPKSKRRAGERDR